jgi:hypothetical protein
MSKIRSNEDPTVRFAKLFAKMYYYMAEQMIESLGEEEGKKAIASAINKFGNDRVRSMKEEAAERNLPLNGREAYTMVRDMPNIGWERNECGIEYCPFHDVWADFGELGMKIGKMYCEIDHVLLNGFDVALERNYCLTSGDKYCEFIFSKLSEQ